MLTPDLGQWNRQRIDAIKDRHPVFLMIQSMHTRVRDLIPSPPGAAPAHG